MQEDAGRSRTFFKMQSANMVSVAPSIINYLNIFMETMVVHANIIVSGVLWLCMCAKMAAVEYQCRCLYDGNHSCISIYIFACEVCVGLTHKYFLSRHQTCKICFQSRPRPREKSLKC